MPPEPPLQPRWTYTNPRGLVRWYGHVDYYGPHVLGEWFALDAETGAERWTTNYWRPNSICLYEEGVIIASETRSDGPWTAGFGIYAIETLTGRLLWINHGRGFAGRLLRWLDFVPGYTNEFRDSPLAAKDRQVITSRGRILDLLTGQDLGKTDVPSQTKTAFPDLADEFYTTRSIKVGTDTLELQFPDDDWVFLRRDLTGRELWQFRVRRPHQYIGGNFYSYRLHDDRIYIVLRNAPLFVPISPAKPRYVRPNPADHQLGVLNITSGACKFYPLTNGRQRKECRLEAIRDSRILLSFDGRDLAEFEV